MCNFIIHSLIKEKQQHILDNTYKLKQKPLPFHTQDPFWGCNTVIASEPHILDYVLLACDLLGLSSGLASSLCFVCVCLIIGTFPICWEFFRKQTFHLDARFNVWVICVRSGSKVDPYDIMGLQSVWTSIFGKPQSLLKKKSHTTQLPNSGGVISSYFFLGPIGPRAFYLHTKTIKTHFMVMCFVLIFVIICFLLFVWGLFLLMEYFLAPI